MWISYNRYSKTGIIFIFLDFFNQVVVDTTIGQQILQSRGLDFDGYYFWISLGALFGFALLFNIGFIMALSYLKGKFSLLIINVNFEQKSAIFY